MRVGTWFGLLVSALVSVGSVPARAQGGTVWAWGGNVEGQLGDGTRTNREAPVQTQGLAEVSAVAAGSAFSLALRSDGTVWAWGTGDVGKLGDGSGADQMTPVRVFGLADVTAIAAGNSHSLALRSDGTVWAWGYNQWGQIGDGTVVDRYVPVPVSGLSGVTAIACGGGHSLARRSDGTVWAWGWNQWGELGDGTQTPRPAPVQVPGLSNVAGVACGTFHSFALLTDGTVWAWGLNDTGRLGTGVDGNPAMPAPVTALTGVAAIAGGHYHSLALKLDGTVWAWGGNQWGQLGIGPQESQSNWPVLVPGLSGVTAIAGGAHHGVALRSDGAVWAWGYNSQGQVGDGSLIDRFVPAPVSGLPGVTAIAGGWSHSLAVVIPLGTTMYTIDRTGTITDATILRGYLRRAADRAALAAMSVAFTIDGTSVGSAITDVNGRASLNWTITDGPPVRTIAAEFAGDQFYTGSRASATLVAQKVATKAYGLDRTARIGACTVLKGYLLRLDNTYITGKTLAFEVDGTPVGSAQTNVNGRAQLGYTVPDAQGTGTRPIVVSWAGDGGYRPSSYATTLTVAKALPRIWVLSKSIWLGETTNLYAYFRRLCDYQKQAAKPVTFLIDGTAVQTVTTDATGVARYTYQTVEPVGVHSIRCEFAGDAWIEAGYGEGTLTIY